MRGTKRCSKCKVEKGLEKFSRDAARKDGRDHRCRECLRARDAQRRLKAKAAGLCSTCTTHPAADGKATCGACLAYDTERYAKAKAAGLCSTCKTHPAADGKASCEDCLAYVAKRRAEAIAAGVCRDCGETLAATSTVLCDAHLAAMTERSRCKAPKTRRAIAARRSAREAIMPGGPFASHRYELSQVCYYCGHEIDVTNRSFDHYVPVAAMTFGWWPTHDPSSVVACCPTCQGQRRATNFETWKPRNQLPTAPCLTDWRTLDKVNQLGHDLWIQQYGSLEAAQAKISEIEAAHAPQAPSSKTPEGRMSVVSV